jgi:hypothetical protein
MASPLLMVGRKTGYATIHRAILTGGGDESSEIWQILVPLSQQFLWQLEQQLRQCS